MCPDVEDGDDPFWAAPACHGWGVFCLDENREEDELTSDFEGPCEQAFAEGLASMLNSAYAAGYDAGHGDAIDQIPWKSNPELKS